MFQNIGWMDDAGAMIMDTVNADIATLPSELQTTLGTDSLQPCVQTWAAQATGQILTMRQC